MYLKVVYVFVLFEVMLHVTFDSANMQCLGVRIPPTRMWALDVPFWYRCRMPVFGSLPKTTGRFQLASSMVVRNDRLLIHWVRSRRNMASRKQSIVHSSECR